MTHKPLVFKKQYKDVTYMPTKGFDGIVEKMMQISEDLRDLDVDGYLDSAHGGAFLVDIKQWDFASYMSTAITCSPFTATVIGTAYDTNDYPSGGIKGKSFVPMFNGGKDKLPKPFWWQHNRDNQPIESIIDYGLGVEVPATQMRRGDLLGIKWVGGHGHAVFCWDVHLNADGEVDAFSIWGSHGAGVGQPYYGISIYGCEKIQVTGKLSSGRPKTGSLKKDPKWNGKIFVDTDEIVANSVWFVLPGVKRPDPKKPDPKALDASTFRTPVTKFSYPTGPSYWIQVADLYVGRLNSHDKLKDPYCMKDGAVSAKPDSSKPAPKPADPPKPPPAPAHAPAPIVVVTKDQVKKDPDAVKKVAPKPAVQEKAKPLQWQIEVEHAMQVFFKTKWIDKDPGKSEDIHDAKSQEAIKAFQKLFHLDPDGDPGIKTRPMIAKQLAACLQQLESERMLVQLFKGGKISTDPGQADGVNDAKTKDAVAEFQESVGLEPSGVPDADTIVKLKEAVEAHAPTEETHGLEPSLEALYWLGNVNHLGQSSTLRLHTHDFKKTQTVKIFVRNGEKGDDVEAKVHVVTKSPRVEVAVPIPAEFGVGSQVFARAKAEISGDKTLELASTAPLYVQPAAPGGALEEFFKLKGELGEREAPIDHTYVAYKVAGKPDAWVMMGRMMMDVDGAPNCYHPKNLGLRTDYWNFDIMKHTGCLDKHANGGSPGNWFGMVTDTGKDSGTPIVQGPNDPFPGFNVAATSLVDKSRKAADPLRYVDARQIPYVAFNYQVYAEAGARFTRIGKGPTGRLGDILTVVNPKADDEHKYLHAIFADVGGRNNPHFGEGSPALGLRIKAYGRVMAEILFICYPHSGADQGTIPSFDEIQSKGDKLFKDWGGMDEVNRVLKAMPK